MKIIEGYRIPFFIRTKAYEPFQSSSFKRDGRDWKLENSRNTGGLENSNHVKKRRHSDGGGFSKSFSSPIFLLQKRLKLQTGGDKLK